MWNLFLNAWVSNLRSPRRYLKTYKRSQIWLNSLKDSTTHKNIIMWLERCKNYFIYSTIMGWVLWPYNAPHELLCDNSLSLPVLQKILELLLVMVQHLSNTHACWAANSGQLIYIMHACLFIIFDKKNNRSTLLLVLPPDCVNIWKIAFMITLH